MGNAGLQELLVILGCCVGLLFPAIFLFFLIMALTRKSRGWTIAAVVAGVITLVTFAIGIAYAVRSGMKEAKEQAEPRTFPTSDGVATVRGRLAGGNSRSARRILLSGSAIPTSNNTWSSSRKRKPIFPRATRLRSLRRSPQNKRHRMSSIYRPRNSKRSRSAG